MLFLPALWFRFLNYFIIELPNLDNDFIFYLSLSHTHISSSRLMLDVPGHVDVMVAKIHVALRQVSWIVSFCYSYLIVWILYRYSSSLLEKNETLWTCLEKRRDIDR